MSGQTRYLISAVCNWIFIILFHVHTTQHLSQAIYIKANADAIKYAYNVAENPLEYRRPEGVRPIYNEGQMIEDNYLDDD